MPDTHEDHLDRKLDKVLDTLSDFRADLTKIATRQAEVVEQLHDHAVTLYGNGTEGLKTVAVKNAEHIEALKSGFHACRTACEARTVAQEQRRERAARPWRDLAVTVGGAVLASALVNGFGLFLVFYSHVAVVSGQVTAPAPTTQRSAP